MATSRRIIAAGGLTGRQLEAEVSREVARIQEEHTPVMPEGRCRVCQHPESRQKVNTLLGYGMVPAEIVNFVEDINARRSKNNKITIDSIRNHKSRHFNVQAPTQAGFRRILERRRTQLAEEFGEASANLLTGKAFLQVVAEKGWQHLIDDTTIVPYLDGLQAMLQLEKMQSEGQIEEKIAQMRRDVSMLQQAVTDVAANLPNGDQVLKQISERINELTGKTSARSEDDNEVIDAEVVDYYDQDDDDQGFSPVMEADEGDSIED